jgi:hypothetical protein
MEVRADALARGFETAPGSYARALEKIYAANLVPVVLGSKTKSHPELYDRMTAAGVAPEYSRPQAPSKRPFFVGLIVMLIAWFILAAALKGAVNVIADRALGPEAAALFKIGAQGASAAEIYLLWDRYGASEEGDILPPQIAEPEPREGSRSSDPPGLPADHDATGVVED